MIDFQTHPDHYHHWRLSVDGPVAFLTMDVDENAGLVPGYELKMNSYDLGVDIELNDAIQRLRFEHPEVGCVVMNSAKERIFCAGANIRMLGQSSHAHKVNFCKFTNETRNAIEDASNHSGQRYLCAVNGTAAGGGYELALACDHIILIDDGSASVSLPEVPLLAVLPGTGGLTRVVDKRKVRRDLADVFCSLEEGVRGRKAVDWRLVDEAVPRSQFSDTVANRANEFAEGSDRPESANGIALTPLQRSIDDDSIQYQYLHVAFDRSRRTATLTLLAPSNEPPTSLSRCEQAGAQFWPLALARELDDALLHLRCNERELGTLLFKTQGDGQRVLEFDHYLNQNKEHWLIREVLLYWRRTLKRVDLSSRTLVTLLEPDSCFVGFLAELVFAADRSYMLDGQFDDSITPAASLRLTQSNFSDLTMCNGLTRLETRFLGEPASLAAAQAQLDDAYDAQAALAAGLITYAPDDIDWEDEIRLFIEERASYSPDALTGMEANLRFPGPETLETKIFGRLTAWQNWIFQRPNAVADDGALKRYGSGNRPQFNFERI